MTQPGPYARPASALPRFEDRRSGWRRLGYRVGQGLLALSGLLLGLLVLVSVVGVMTDHRHGGAYAVIGALMLLAVVVFPIATVGALLVWRLRPREALAAIAETTPAPTAAPGDANAP